MGKRGLAGRVVRRVSTAAAFILVAPTVLLSVTAQSAFASVGGQRTFFPTAPSSSNRGIAVGSDGALWFTEIYNNTIGRISTTGQITTFSLSGDRLPNAITAGPDGALWFTERQAATHHEIGRITTSWDRIHISLSPDINEPCGYHGRARRCPVVHQPKPHDRADDHQWCSHGLHGLGHRLTSYGITAGPRRGVVVHRPGIRRRSRRLHRENHHLRSDHELH